MLHSGDLNGAADLAKRILELEPRHPEALRAMGHIHRHQNQIAQAGHYYQRVLHTMPHDRMAIKDATDCLPAPQMAEAVEQLYKQIRELQRDAPDPLRPRIEVAETSLGPFALPVFPERDLISRTIRSGRMFDEVILDAARPYIFRETTVIDAGANFGQISVALGRFLEGSGQVVACEADPYIAEILRRNIALSASHNVEAVQCALYDEDGRTLIFPEPDFDRYLSFGSFGLNPKATQGRAIITRKIDSLPIRHRVSFIKIDVQGADLHALRGAREVIARDRPAIIFEYEENFQEQFGTSFQQYADFVASIDYVFVRVIDKINYLIVPRVTT